MTEKEMLTLLKKVLEHEINLARDMEKLFAQSRHYEEATNYKAEVMTLGDILNLINNPEFLKKRCEIHKILKIDEKEEAE